MLRRGSRTRCCPPGACPCVHAGGPERPHMIAQMPAFFNRSWAVGPERPYTRGAEQRPSKTQRDGSKEYNSSEKGQHPPPPLPLVVFSWIASPILSPPALLAVIQTDR